MITVFTELSETKINNDRKGVERRLKKSSKDLLNLMIPLTAWLILTAESLVVLLFQRGNFNARSSELVTSAFIGYAFILIISPIYNLLIKTFTAYKKTRVTFFVSLISICLNYLFNSLLIEKYGVLGLAISSSLVVTINTIILYFYQKKVMGLVFLDKRHVLINSLLNLLVVIALFFLKNVLNQALWLIITNIVCFIIFFIYNKRMLIGILNKIRGVKA